jgi:hypothetical protein
MSRNTRMCDRVLTMRLGHFYNVDRMIKYDWEIHKGTLEKKTNLEIIAIEKATRPTAYV